jgi:hypothetical protein
VVGCGGSFVKNPYRKERLMYACLRQLAVFSLAFLILQPKQVSAVSISGTTFLDEKGEEVVFHGINWFGFNNQGTMVNGLWSGKTNMTLDFSTVVRRMELLGFNAVRLPFSFKDLAMTPLPILRTDCTLASEAEMEAALTPPQRELKGIFFEQSHPIKDLSLGCNHYVPSDSTMNRFLFVLRFFVQNGFYVLIDNHLREDQTVLESKDKWIGSWVDLARNIYADDVLRGKVFFDLLNEPQQFDILWEEKNGKPALKDLYLEVMDAIWKEAPGCLFFIEGTGQGKIKANWGDGFATDVDLIKEKGLSDPNPFFKALLQKPYKTSVVISPHVYPPTVTFNEGDEGENLWTRLNRSFGYLETKGYCLSEGECQVFPVVIGETGSHFTDKNDLEKWLPDFKNYCQNKGPAKDSLHKANPHIFWWSWNPNSGDTGGLVDEGWLQIAWAKIDYLIETFGLKPWYLGGLAHGTPKKPDIQITIPENPLKSGDENYSAPEKEDKKDTTTPQDTPDETQTKPDEAVASNAGCQVKILLGTPWQINQTYFNTVNLFVTQRGNTAVPVPWQVSYQKEDISGVASAWNMDVSLAIAGSIEGATTAPWQQLQPLGANQVNLGFIVQSKTSDVYPTSVSINGVACSLE